MDNRRWHVKAVEPGGNRFQKIAQVLSHNTAIFDSVLNLMLSELSMNN